MKSALIETVLMVKPDWPGPYCPGVRNQQHDLFFDLGTYMCRWCDATIWSEEAPLVSLLWSRMARAVGDKLN